MSVDTERREATRLCGRQDQNDKKTTIQSLAIVEASHQTQGHFYVWGGCAAPPHLQFTSLLFFFSQGLIIAKRKFTKERNKRISTCTHAQTCGQANSHNALSLSLGLLSYA
jgi:hypothetical protein